MRRAALLWLWLLSLVATFLAGAAIFAAEAPRPPGAAVYFNLVGRADLFMWCVLNPRECREQLEPKGNR
jgi:hypothetical protein